MSSKKEKKLHHGASVLQISSQFTPPPPPPKLCSCFTAISIAMKREIRKISIGWQQFFCYLGQSRGNQWEAFGDLARAANHCDLNENGLFFNNTLQTQCIHASSRGFSVGTKSILAQTSFFLSHGFHQYIHNPFKAHNRGGTHASRPRLSLSSQIDA